MAQPTEVPDGDDVWQEFQIVVFMAEMNFAVLHVRAAQMLLQRMRELLTELLDNHHQQRAKQVVDEWNKRRADRAGAVQLTGKYLQMARSASRRRRKSRTKARAPKPRLKDSAGVRLPQIKVITR